MKSAKRTLLLSAPLLLASAVAQAQQGPLPGAPPPPGARMIPGMPPHRIEIFRRLQGPGGNAPGRTYSTVIIRPSTSSGNYLGARIADVTRETMAQLGAREPGGVALSDIIAGGPAEKAGLQKNDLVLKFEGETVSSNAKLKRLISEAAPESRVRLLIRRDGAEREVTVTLGRRSSAPRGLFEARPQAEGGLMPPPNDRVFRAVPVPRGAPPAVPGQPGFAVPRIVPVPRAGNPALRGLFATRATRTIGITPAELTDQLREFFGVAKERGVLVSSVTKDSPADKAGIKAGDVITQVDETPVSKSGDLTRAVNRKSEGDVTLTVVRDKTARTLTLTPQRRAATVSTFGRMPAVELERLLERMKPPSLPASAAPLAPPVAEAPPESASLPAIGQSSQPTESETPNFGAPPLAVSPLQSPW